MLNRLGFFLIKKPFVVLFSWLFCFIFFAFFAVNVDDKLSGDLSPPKNSEATLVQEMIKDKFNDLDTEQIIITASSKTHKIGDRIFDSEVSDLISTINLNKDVQEVITYKNQGFSDLGQVGDLEEIIIVGLKSQSLEESQKTTNDLRAEIKNKKFSLDVNVTGLAAIANDLSNASEKDVSRSGKLALPFTLFLLIIAFGSIIAAFIPPLIGFISLVITLGILTLITNIYPVHALAQPVVAMLGLAAGIDYTLLMVSRFREEVNLGKTIDDAILETVNNSGKTVLFSGFIVVLSLTALLFPPLNIIRSIGLTGMIVIILAMATATTLVPVLLKLFGKFIVKNKSSKNSTPFESNWTKWGQFVIKRKYIVSSAAFLLLIVLATPIYSMNIHNDGVDNLADSVESKKSALILEKKGLAGTLDRIDILISTDQPVSNTLYALTEDLEALNVKLILSPTPIQIPFDQVEQLYALDPDEYLANELISQDKKNILIRVMPKEKLNALTNDIFIESIKNTVEEHVSLDKVSFGGDPIAFKEFDDALFKSFPLAIAFVLIVTFILLTIVFRSVYMSFVAILSNVLILGASFGLLVYYFQDYLKMTSLHPMVPIIVFAIIFGLSMDYQVFLLSRIKEERIKGATVKQSIVKGMASTSRIITYAGLIMFVVFFAFILSDVMTVKMLGFGLAVAIILDITIARLILMPALLAFQKDKNS